MCKKSKYYITVDGGTTNTRLSLVKDGVITDTVKLNIGARSNIDNKELFIKQMHDAVRKLIENACIASGDVCRILASGMITSEFGLCNLPHIAVPAGIAELHDSMHEMLIPDISDIPFVFIRGVKTGGAVFEETDMMRGEETELMGIVDTSYGDCIYILPGSHSKIIRTDSQGRICDFSTMLTGEMIAALSQNTILKDAVDLSVNTVDTEYLLKGYDICKAHGINKALFKTRILKNLFGCTKEQTYSYFIGVVLAPEIENVLCSGADTVVIGGRSQIKIAMATILESVSSLKVVPLDDTAVSQSTSLGAIKVYEYSADN